MRIPSRDARGRQRDRLLWVIDVVAHVELDEEDVLLLIEARGTHARKLAQLELEVVEGTDGLARDARCHRLASFAS